MSSNTVGSVLKSLRTGKTTAVETVTKYLKYIERYNKTINAVVTLNENVLEEARQLDQLFLQNGVTGPLHGLPVVVKDCFATKGIRTVCGSSSLKDNIPTYDAEVVHLLKLAGALVIGKSNTPEMCMDVQTFNPVFGVTNNPFDTSKTAGGSSGGSAAAVACNMAPVAIGSDLAGSLRIPASFCGIVSLKPTAGRLMIQGHIPPLPSVPTFGTELVVGPMANDVKSLEIIMHVLSRRNFCNRTHIGLYDFEFPLRPFHILEKPQSQTLRIALTPHIEGIPTDWRIVRSITKFAQRLTRVGVTCHIVESLPHGFPSMKDMLEAHKILATEYDSARSLKTPSEKHPEDRGPTSSQVGAAKMIRSQTRHAIEAFLEAHDAWILPVSCVLPFAHNPEHGPIACEVDVDDTQDAGARKSAGGAGANAGASASGKAQRHKKVEIPYWRALTSYVTPFSVSGNPVLTLPIGGVCEECEHWQPDTASVCRKCGFGFGVQIVGRRWEDEKLTAVGRVLEKLAGIKSRDRSLNIGKRAKL
eukprot:Phypoly_transcript_06332.p1 GENE.Phypoly_transcript_06332~~Phypoly_transcript_06332.p1  ORF type:complete len:530 (+),score=72.65 Phypoly_transcript_06332:180-1769(+)